MASFGGFCGQQDCSKTETPVQKRAAKANNLSVVKKLPSTQSLKPTMDHSQMLSHFLNLFTFRFLPILKAQSSSHFLSDDTRFGLVDDMRSW